MTTAVLDSNSHVVDVEDGASGAEIVGVSSDKEKRSSYVSECSVLELDLSSEVKAHLEELEKDCRICHLSLDLTSLESIELGCSCKEDLAAAHKQCAEAWFKIKGNKTCEICGSTALNVVGSNEGEVTEQYWSEDSDVTVAPAVVQRVEIRSFWRGHRILKFLLGCMVFAFVISWLFHFKVK